MCFHPQAAPSSPAQGLTDAQPLPRGAAALGDTGWLSGLRASPAGCDLNCTASGSLLHGAPGQARALQCPDRLPGPPAFLTSASPRPAQGHVGTWAATASLGAAEAANSAGLARYLEERPRGSPSTLSGRPRPWSEAAGRLRARGGWPSLARLCPHAGRNDNYSCSYLITLRGLSNSQGGQDRV